jgi:hypothetical protein
MKSVETELNRQQRQLLDKLRKKHGLGGDDGEVVRFAFQQYVKAFLPAKEKV